MGELKVSRFGNEYMSYYVRKRPIPLGQVLQTVKCRDKGVCRDCGTAMNLEVHHLDGSRRKGKGFSRGRHPRNNIDNLILLCQRCHSLRHEQHQLSIGRKLEVQSKRDDDGMTFSEIGKCLGITRQRAHQLYHAKI